MLLDALRLRTSKLFGLRAKRKFYNCSPFLGQNGRKTATTTAPPAKLAHAHAPVRPSRALVAAWGRCAPILATPLLPQCHKQGPKRGVSRIVTNGAWGAIVAAERVGRRRRVGAKDFVCLRV